MLAEVFGGISVALARSFRIVDPRVTNPSSEHWDRAFDDLPAPDLTVVPPDGGTQSSVPSAASGSGRMSSSMRR